MPDRITPNYATLFYVILCRERGSTGEWAPRFRSRFNRAYGSSRFGNIMCAQNGCVVSAEFDRYEYVSHPPLDYKIVKIIADR